MDFSSIQIGRMRVQVRVRAVNSSKKKLKLPRESLQRIRLSYFIGCYLQPRWKEQIGVFLLFQTINSSLPSYKDNSFPRTEHNLPGHGLEPTSSSLPQERARREGGEAKDPGNEVEPIWSPAYEPSGGCCPCIFQVFLKVSLGLPAQ